MHLPLAHAQTGRSQSWPFVVRPARDDHDLSRVAVFRAAAYGRHLPEFAVRMREIELADRARASVVLLAEDKLARRIIGSVRLHLGRDIPLPLESSLVLPTWLVDDGPLLEPTRLAVEASESGALARNALFKACFLYARAAGATWLVAAARRPLDVLYGRLLFRDIFGDGLARPMKHIGDLPHRVLGLPLRGVEALYQSRRHPLSDYVFETEHPGLMVDAARLLEPARRAA
jgi:hypothetical protein